MLISLDTEATGLDWAHGAKPFLVTTCDDSGLIRYFEWDVDPFTREPDIPSGDVAEIAELIDAADLIYLHNSKFDAHMLRTIGLTLPWSKVRDTLCAGHLLASNHPHDLTSMCIEYLGQDISKYEEKVKEVTRACRTIVKRDYPNWRIAREGDGGMPSVKESSKRDEDKPWKNDMWLPRAFIKEKCGNRDVYWAQGDKQFGHGWSDACSRYANADSEHTLFLGLRVEQLIRERGYWNIYLSRLHLPRLAYEMECYGVTAIGDFTESTIDQYARYVAEAGVALQEIAAEMGHDLQLAEGAALNNNMREFFYGSIRQKCPNCKYDKCVKHWNGEFATRGDVCPKCSGRKRNPVNSVLRVERKNGLNLHVIAGKKSDRASLDKDAMQEYITTLEDGPALEFIKLLMDKRRHDTDLSYMEAYRRFWVPIYIDGCVGKGYETGYYRIHPSLNPFGTDHLRWSSNSPNLQNVSTQEDEDEEEEGARLSVRRCFGPAPGREWYTMDFKNIEKRIPAYEANEPKLIEIFEKPNEPPYWGSDHNLIASLLFPDEFWPLAEQEGAFKKQHLQKYKRVKNTNFAKQYGAGKRKVEATSGVVGAFEMIDRGLPELAKLQAKYLRDAEKTGWVHTLPDRTVDETKGYPILASRTEDGRVLSTTPFNYHVSGTACECKNMALLRCSKQLAEWRAEGFDAWLSLEIHDELLFDFPRGRTPDANHERAMVLRELMEQSGKNLVPSIPTPVSVEYHDSNWAKGVSVV